LLDILPNIPLIPCQHKPKSNFNHRAGDDCSAQNLPSNDNSVVMIASPPDTVYALGCLFEFRGSCLSIQDFIWSFLSWHMPCSS
jgi:hypothetical protein